MSPIRKLFVTFYAIAVAAALAAGAMAATGMHAAAKANPPVEVQVFAPRAGEMASSAVRSKTTVRSAFSS